MHDEWISTADAAKMLGYTRSYFRDVFCNPENPLVTIRARPLAQKSRNGRARHRILVSRASIEAIIKAETKHAKS